MKFFPAFFAFFLFFQATPELFSQCEQCRSERDGLRKQIAKLAEEKKQINKQLQVSRDELNKTIANAGSSGTNSGQQQEIDRLKKEINGLNNRIGKINTEIKKLKNRIAELERENAELRSTLEAKGVTIVQLRDTVNMLAQGIEDYGKQNDSLSAGWDNSRKEASQKAKNIDSLVALIGLSSTRLYAEYRLPFPNHKKAYYLPLDHLALKKSIGVNQDDVSVNLNEALPKARRLTRIIAIVEVYSTEPGTQINAELELVNKSKEENLKAVFPIKLENDSSKDALPYHYFYCHQPISLATSKGKKNVITPNASYECTLTGPRLMPFKFKFDLD